MADFGLVMAAPEEEPDLNFYVWPDNWSAVMVFKAMKRHFDKKNGFALSDYVDARFALGLKRKDWQEILPDVMFMERKALESLNG